MSEINKKIEFQQIIIIMDNYLKRLRKSKGLSTKEVLKELHISQGYYSRIENGTRTPPTDLLTKIATLYGADKKELNNYFKNKKPQFEASLNWIWKIKAGKMSVIDAFKKERFLLQGQLNKDELISLFIKFIQFNIERWIRKELEKEENGRKYNEEFLLKKLRFKEYQD